MKNFVIIGLSSAAVLAAPALGQNMSDRIAQMQTAQNQQQSADQSGGAILGALVYTDIAADFNDTPVRLVMDYIDNVLGIPMVVRYNDDRTAMGIDPDTPITLDIPRAPALTILEAVLEQCEDLEECTWQLRNGFLEVSTKDRLSMGGARELRFYPIRDLLMEIPYFDNGPQLDLNNALNQGQQGGGGGGGGGGGRGGGGGFGGGGGGGGSGGGNSGDVEDIERKSETEKAQEIQDLITTFIEPDAWEANGGDAAMMRYYQGTLIIKAPDFVHRQIGGYPFPIVPPSATPAPLRRSVQISQGGKVYVNLPVTTINQAATTNIAPSNGSN